jgi:3-methyladenine DNA glycosylase AlkC
MAPKKSRHDDRPVAVGTEENESALKHLFGPKLLKRVSDAIAKAYPAFDRRRFLALMPELASLEMKPRVRFLRDELKKLLPSDYSKALKILLESVRQGKLEGFELWPYTEFVQTYGLHDPALSLDALKELTPAFTSEWAVRPFIARDPSKTMKYLLACAGSKDEHVRRWASEGSRPRLPWGERLQEFVRDPSPTLPILEKLKFDPELYVRKSVCNHLNDIAKDHPELVVKILARWQKEAGQEHAAKIDWIVRRSLRTLIKQGHSGALKLIGVSRDAQIEFARFKVLRKTVRLGEHVDFEFEIRSLSPKAQKLVVDYVVHFVKANQGTAPKVFKLRTVELPGKATLSFAKSHPVKKITTRVYYPGTHFIEIQVNGIVAGKLSWKLEA